MDDYENMLTIAMSILSVIGMCMIVVNFWLDFLENK